MVTPQEKAQCVSWFIETKSDVQTQRRYRTKYGKNPPSRSPIRRWHKKFMETGSVLDAVKTGRPRIFYQQLKIGVKIRCLKHFKNITSTNMFVFLVSLAHRVSKIL